MANEINLSLNFTTSKNGGSVSSTTSLSNTMSGDNMISNVQIIPFGTGATNATAIAYGDVSTIGYVVLKNVDATNFIEVAVSNGVTSGLFTTQAHVVAKLLPGEVVVLKPKTTTLYAIADTAGAAASNLMVTAVEL